MDHSAAKITPAIVPLKLAPDELALLHRQYAKRKTKGALDKLFRSHAPLAIMLARRFSVHSNHLSDLQMAAFRGLLQALDRYDPLVGKFTTFAYWWILKFILKEREFDQNIVKLPLGFIRKHRRIRQLINDGFSIKTIARKLNLPITAVETLYGLYDRPHCVSIEEHDFADFEGVISAGDRNSELLGIMAETMTKLPLRWRTAVTLRFRVTGKRSFADIGKKMKCAPQTACMYYHRALVQLKKEMTQQYGRVD